ncbi:MAG: DUF3347 domain-containing protein [Ferruginibacter sp.]|nr:DUF3347 domain-containing protein [Ferruginibacter sp.]
MKKFLGFVVLIFAGWAVWWFFIKDDGPAKPKPPKQQPVTLNKNSAQFNASLNELVTSYLSLKDALVQSDTARATEQSGLFNQLLDSIPYAELQNDSAQILEGVEMIVKDLRHHAVSISGARSLQGMREHFSSLSDLLYPGFLKMVNYEGAVLYVQHCPMAFNGDQGANWLSRESEIMNPYLGKDHPIYKGGMLHCGEVLDSIAP